MRSVTSPVRDSASPISSKTFRLQLTLGGILCALVLGLVANPSMPWESDQPAKAAQIIEIVNRHGYLLTSDVPGCYFLKFLPLYYATSGLIYTITDGDIFTFMNYSSVLFGVVAALSLAWALYNSLRIPPFWSLPMLLCMPLFVITYTYGNETAWSVAFFCLSLALVSSRRRTVHYAAGAAVAFSLFCRTDVMFLAPFWFGWSLLFCKTDEAESWIKRLLPPISAFLITCAILWLLLLREIPEGPTSFEWSLNLKLIAAYFTYPFNPSIVLLGAIGWLLLVKQRPAYAWTHFLLLLPVAFYIRNLSSPKYVICLMLFYGVPAAYLLDRVRNSLRLVMVAAVALWFFAGISPFGIFGPTAASLWYVPTSDGPCPIGGYVAFYARAHKGVYQVKQVEHIAQARDFVEFAKNSDGHYWIAGHWPIGSFPLLRALGEFGTPEQEARVEKIRNAPGSQGGEQPNDGSQLLVFRSGYLDLSSMHTGMQELVRAWLTKGQVRPVGPGASQPLPTLIELGSHIPEGENGMLGKRLLFAIDYFKGHMAFEQPEFIAPYRATSWAAPGTKADVEPIYRDEQVAVFDRPVENAKVFSYPYPSRYFEQKSPIPQFRGHLAE
jgi:hypothetical protein